MTPVFERLKSALQLAGIDFTLTHHAPVYTSAEAAAVRGVSLHSGAKALILKGEDGFLMAVIPADLALDSNALRKHLGAKRMRFATKEEVLELTGLTPGSIPPFGSLFSLAARGKSQSVECGTAVSAVKTRARRPCHTFHHGLLGTICDTRLQENERINFNAGSHTDSIQMSYMDYIRHESPTLAEIAKAAT